MYALSILWKTPKEMAFSVDPTQKGCLSEIIGKDSQISFDDLHTDVPLSLCYFYVTRDLCSILL